MWRQFSFPIGFRFPSLVFFFCLPDTIGYISVTNTWVKNTPWHNLHQEFSLSIPQWISYRSGIHQDMNCWLPWNGTYIKFPHILRIILSQKWKFEYLHQYIYLDKIQIIVEVNIIILKMILHLVCVSSSNVGGFESHKSNNGLGQK